MRSQRSSLQGRDRVRTEVRKGPLLRMLPQRPRRLQPRCLRLRQMFLRLQSPRLLQALRPFQVLRALQALRLLQALRPLRALRPPVRHPRFPVGIWVAPMSTRCLRSRYQPATNEVWTAFSLAAIASPKPAVFLGAQLLALSGDGKARKNAGDSQPQPNGLLINRGLGLAACGSPRFLHTFASQPVTS